MGSIRFSEAVAAVAAHIGVCTESWSAAEPLGQLENIDSLARILSSLRHELINQLGAQASREELGGSPGFALAQRLRIDRGEAGRRICEAADLAAREHAERDWTR
jgi:hypothetical protein